MNYATYFAGSDGRIACCGADFHQPFWFSDGYADYLRHFSWTMGALPDLAPIGESHILRSTSVIQKVSYSHNRIAYKTFDSTGTQVARLSFKPAKVTVGGSSLRERSDLKEPGFTIEAAAQGDYIVRVRQAGGNDVVIEGR
jgi:hypothetical protein